MMIFAARFRFLFLCAALLCAVPGMAQDYVSPDTYYRPVTRRDLDYRLTPKNSARDGGFFAPRSAVFDGKCPQEVNIGGVDQDSKVLGNVDIDVSVGQDIVINCR